MGSKSAAAACDVCRRRRVKCDRGDPCSNCVRRGVLCTASHDGPLRRGRQGGRRSNEMVVLRDKVAELESLIHSIGGPSNASSQLPSPTSPDATGPILRVPTRTTSNGSGRYVSEPAWSQLSAQIDSIRDLLVTELDEDEIVRELSPVEQPSSINFVLGPQGTIHVSGLEVTQHPAAHVREALFRVYCQNVHAVCKVVHRPSLCALFQKEPDCISLTAAENALLFALYAAALVSLQDSEWFLLSVESRSDTLRRYISVVEYFLHRANFLESRDLMTLQAFVLYLIVVRAQNRGQRHWALLALAVRLAREHGLDSAKAVNSFPLIQREAALRLWVVLRTLDFRSVFECGSEPSIQLDSFDTPDPTNVDDSQITDGSLPQPSTKLNSGTLGLLHTAGMTLWMKLYTIDTDTEYENSIWAFRLHLVDEYETNMQQFFQNSELDPSEYGVIQHIFHALCRLGRLMALRPLTKRGKSRPSFPAHPSRQVLDLAIQSLRAEQNLFDKPALAGYRWATWVHWYPLVVALAEVCRDPGTLTAGDIWDIIHVCYERQSQQIALTATRTPWRLVEKLMKHARTLRGQSTNGSVGLGPLHQAGSFGQSLSPVFDAGIHDSVQIQTQEVEDPLLNQPAMYAMYNDQMLDWSHLLEDAADFAPWGSATTEIWTESTF